MKNRQIYPALLSLLASFLSLPAFAWDHSIEIGYGQSHDPNHTKYTNSGFMLSGDICPIARAPYTFWSLNGAVGRWRTSTPVHKNLTTAALSVALRVYPFKSEYEYKPYFLGSVGPAYLSSQKFGYNSQAGRLTFQWNLGFGAEFKRIDLNFRLAHFSNAYLAKPDQGFTVLYMLSLGYLI